MANHIFILATVMLLAGIFGGLVNYYLYGDKDPDAAVCHAFWWWVSVHPSWCRLFSTWSTVNWCWKARVIRHGY